MSSITEPEPGLRAPAFLGGVLNNSDFVPSVIFVVLYALLIVPMLLRLCWPQTRIYVLWATVPWAMESIAIYTLRAIHSHSSSAPGSPTWFEELQGSFVYMQIAFSVGFMAIATDCVFLFRTVLVNATLADPERGSEDKPIERARYRKQIHWCILLYLMGSIPGMIAGGFYSKALYQQKCADVVYVLRYLSAAMSLLGMLLFILIMQIARRRVPNIDPKAISFLTTVMSILCILPVYRLSVMHSTTSAFLPLPPSYTTYPPGNLSTPKDKALFYIFHCLPEYISILMLVSTDLRKVLNAGQWGDWRKSDKQGIPTLRKNGMLRTNEMGEELPECKKVENSEDNTEKDLESCSEPSSRKETIFRRSLFNAHQIDPDTNVGCFMAYKLLRASKHP